jgi:hypothetical protein
MIPKRRSHNILSLSFNGLRSSLRKSQLVAELDDEPIVGDLKTYTQCINHIKNEKWTLLIDDLPTSGFKGLNDTFQQRDEVFDGSSILHFVLKYCPPQSVVSRITEELRDLLDHTDRQGHTPLHVAIKLQTSTLVTLHLIQRSAKACSIQDESDGKTPLHLIFDDAFDKAVQTRNTKKIMAYSVLIEALVDVSPSSLDIEDQNGMCAVEMAIVAEAPMTIVKLLQTAKRCHRRLSSLQSCPHDVPRRRSLTSPSA